MGTGIRSWFRNLLRRRVVEASLDEELRACVDILAANKERDGLAPTEARRQALLEIGGVDVVKERVRDVRRASLVEAFIRDLRHAARILRRQPLLTGAIVITLGIGIGSPASAFSLFNHFIFAPPPNPDPGAFFRATKTFDAGRHQTAISVEEYQAIRDRSTSARQVAAWSVWMLHEPLGTEDPSPVTASLVSCNLFTLFRVDAPVAGRLFTRGDCETDVPVAVLNERTWRTRFGANPSVVGTTMRYGGAQVVVVGVAAVPSLRRQWDDADERVDLFVPYTAFKAMTGNGYWPTHDGWLHLGGLLRPGVTRDVAAAEFESIAFAAKPPAPNSRVAIALTDGSRWAEAPGEMLGILVMAMALPVLILFMSCVNVSALLLSRSVSRRHEMAVRLALGTSKGALVRMLLTETLLMAGLAAGLALIFVAVLPATVVHFFDAETWFGSSDVLIPDWRVLTTIAVCGIAAAVLAGLTPALAALNPRPVESLKGRRDSDMGGTSRTRRWLVGLQIAASMVPLVVAVAFWSAVTRAANPGFPTAGLVVAPVPQEKPRDVSLGVLARALSATPGVEAVAFGDTLPWRMESPARLKASASEGFINPPMAAVSRAYFDLLGVSIVSGRTFDARDEASAATARPVVISVALARRLFGWDRGLGEHIEAQIPSGKIEQWTVIGISSDRPIGTTMSRRTLADGSMVYQLLPESSKAGLLLVKTGGDAEAIAGPVRDRLRALTGSAATVRTLEAAIAESFDGVRKLSVIMLGLGVMAFLLAIVGVVGTVSFDARQRRKEFAIRYALGAGPWVVRRRVIFSGLRPMVPAVLVGLLGAWGALSAADAERLAPAQSIATEPAPYVAITVLLLVSVLATLMAIAYPAARRDPLIALREE